MPAWRAFTPDKEARARACPRSRFDFSASLLGLCALLTSGASAVQAQADSAPRPGRAAARADGRLRCTTSAAASARTKSTAMRAAMKDYPLSLLFARADGAYEANVDVRITPQGGGDAMQLRGLLAPCACCNRPQAATVWRYRAPAKPQPHRAGRPGAANAGFSVLSKIGS